MRYNQLTYHKANPFFKQGYLPDRAWYNRKPKQYPSQIPTGQQYFTDSGRKHYQNKFNHSEIQENNVLQSPEKYPFQNRIAMDKTYRRSLDTTDIEGAGSGTRVNEAVRMKLRAQEELARKHNTSLDMKEHKEHQYEEKRRQLALKQYETLQLSRISKQKQQEEQTKKEHQRHQRTQSHRDNPEKQRYGQPEQERGNQGQYIRLQPKDYCSHLQQPQVQPLYTHKYIQPVSKSTRFPPRQYSTLQPSSPPAHSSPPEFFPREQSYSFSHNDRHQNNPAYVNNYETQLERRKVEHQRNSEIQKAAKEQFSDRKQFRKYNPTNLSFSLAGQSIVGSNKQ